MWRADFFGKTTKKEIEEEKKALSYAWNIIFNTE